MIDSLLKDFLSHPKTRAEQKEVNGFYCCGYQQSRPDITRS
jgi:hypothetical protein